MGGQSGDFGCNLSAPACLENEGTSLHKYNTGKQRAQQSLNGIAVHKDVMTGTGES